MTEILLLFCIACVALAAVSVLGYLLWLRTASAKTAGAVAPSNGRPSVDIVVCVHNEASLIGGRIENLAVLRYPAGWCHRWIVDGGSTDGTAHLAESATRGEKRFTVIRTDRADKIAQLNAVLPRLTGDWVLVTDADAQLPPDTLERLMDAALAAPGIAVVGASVEPAAGHALEQLHWRIANRLRCHESRRGAASIVTGPCYLFRRDLVDRLPADVVADDVHIALLAAVSGKTVCFESVRIAELRAPRSLVEMFWHKRRKADAYLREMFRFLPGVACMSRQARAVFLWRAAQLFLIPVLVVFLAAALPVLAGRGEYGGAAALGAAMGALPLTVLRFDGRYDPRTFAQGIGLAALLTAVLVTALIGYPFSRQTAAYPKIATLRRRGAFSEGD